MGSIPNIIPLDKTKYIAYILHDKLMCSKKYTRKQADRILIEAMNVEGAKTWEKIIVYI